MLTQSMKIITSYGPNAINRNRLAGVDDLNISGISSDSASEFKDDIMPMQNDSRNILSLRSANSSPTQISKQIRNQICKYNSQGIGEDSPRTSSIKTKKFQPRRKMDSNLIQFKKESNSMHNILLKGMSKHKLVKKEAISPQQMRSLKNMLGSKTDTHKNRNSVKSPFTTSKKSA